MFTSVSYMNQGVALGANSGALHSWLALCLNRLLRLQSCRDSVSVEGAVRITWSVSLCQGRDPLRPSYYSNCLGSSKLVQSLGRPGQRKLACFLEACQ